MNKFLTLLQDRKTDYATWVPIHCKAIGQEVVFNMMGFNHLRFKTDNTPRDPKTAMYKLGLLPLVRPVIHSATKIDSYERRTAPVGGTRTKIYKEFEYWALVAVVGKQKTKLKVILRKAVNGTQVHFWSVMKL